MSNTRTIPSFGAKLRSAMSNAIISEAGEDFLAMCDDNIVFKFPFTPKGSVTQVTGKPALTKYLSTVSKLIEFESFSDSIVHPSADGKTFIIEFSCKGLGIDTGLRYDQNYVAIIRLHNRKIVEYRDYWNPLILLEAVGGIDKLTETLKEFIDE